MYHDVQLSQLLRHNGEQGGSTVSACLLVKLSRWSAGLFPRPFRESYLVSPDRTAYALLCGLVVFRYSVQVQHADIQAAYVRMQADGQLSYHQFEAVPHPDVKPMAYSSGFNFMNGM